MYNDHRFRTRNQRKKSPYLKIGSIAAIVASAFGVASIMMFLFTSILLVLTVAFILLKVTALVTFGWGWVFSPIWLPTLILFGIGGLTFIGGYLYNLCIFIKRLCTGKIGK